MRTPKANLAASAVNLGSSLEVFTWEACHTSLLVRTTILLALSLPT